MHELSIAASIVDTVTASLAAYPGAQVKEVRLRLGVLSGVFVDALEFCWGIATEGTPLAGATLKAVTLPVVVHCDACRADTELNGAQSFRCARCGELTMDVRQGKELEVESIEIDEAEQTV